MSTQLLTDQSVRPLDTITLESPLDMHLHLRQGRMLERVLPASAKHFAGAVIMPNLLPPITSLEALKTYRDDIMALVQGDGDAFEPYMTLFFRDYNHAELQAAKDHLIGIKLYPDGVTTNSAGGVRSLQDYHHTLAAMADLGIPLLVHGETDGFVLDRERDFLAQYRYLAQTFPELTIVMEHITTREAAELLDDYANLHATITVHHLLITLNDVVGGLLRPHLFCKPIAKRPEDRAALLALAVNAHPKVMFGSDSAPHPRHAKEACGCAAGVFSAPAALPLLVDLFEQQGALANLPAFVSGNAQRIYDLTPVRKQVTLVRQAWQVDDALDDAPAADKVTMFAGGETLAWQVQDVQVLV